MNKYTVELQELYEGEYLDSIVFECMADDVGHAVEQTRDAYFCCVILKVTQTRTREQLNTLIEQAFLIVKDDVDFIVDGLSPEDKTIHVHTVDGGEEFVFDYEEITDDDLIYGLQILNPA
jgi:hypothetical protein